MGTGPSFRYTTHSLGDAAVLSLQRSTGDGTWTTLSHPPKGANLTTHAPVLGRPAATCTGCTRSTGANSPTRVVYAYKNLTVQTVCPHTDGNQQFPRVCKQKTVHVGTTDFVTYMAIGATKYPSFFAGASLTAPSCRSAHLRFATTANSTSKAYLKITQGNSIPVLRGQAVAAVAHIGTLDVTLGSQKVYFNGSTESGGASVYLTGTLSCWTATGVVP